VRPQAPEPARHKAIRVRIARYNGGRIGVVVADRIHDVTIAAGVDPGEWPPVGIIRTIASFERLRAAIEAAAQAAPGLPVGSVHLETPIPWPHKLLALPGNFHAHRAEMAKRPDSAAKSAAPAETAGFFMKSNGSLSGASDPIRLPDRPGRDMHHECEIAIVIGRGGRNITRDRALEHVFGYACLLDITMRGKEERVMRKSFDTFCPVGPWITTADEAGDPDTIAMRLWVNGELRQEAPTTDMIVGIREAIAMISAVTTLVPGDIIASGTMSGVGPIAPGDTVTIEVDRVGKMSVDVVAEAVPAAR
jgi:2-keto-4-pentenoate hydratase/2-oxohepta-3-ene-1,7-dioic acid hydratase in catechol pathway